MDRLDDVADDYWRKVNGYTAVMKKWEVVTQIKTSVETFRQTLPLIKMLKEPYMRSRHWDKMQKALGQVLEYESENFAIGEYFKLNLLSQADSVREVCEVAREEF